MKKFYIILVAVMFVVGCGNNNETTQKEQTIGQTEYMTEAYAHLSEGDVTAAIENFDAAIRQNPTNTENYIPLGELYLRLKNFTAAVDTFNAATKVDPNDGEAQYFLALSSMLKARIEQTQGNQKEYEHYHDKALTAGKQSAEIFMQAKDEERFKKSVSLVQTLTNNTQTK